jgi:outer membrane lipoprotein-sorting protein
MKLAAVLLTTLLTVATGAAQTSTAVSRDQVLARMAANAKSFKSLDAAIERRERDSLAEIDSVDSGRIYIQTTRSSPRIKLELTEPEKSAKFALIENGRFQMYEKAPNTIIDRKVKNEDQLQLLLMGFGVAPDKIETSYTIGAPVPETVGSEPVTMIELQARDAGSQIPKIRLWLSHKDWTPVRTELTQRNRNTLTVSYKEKKLNTPVPDAAFSLKVPRDAKKL